MRAVCFTLAALLAIASARISVPKAYAGQGFGIRIVDTGSTETPTKLGAPAQSAQKIATAIQPQHQTVVPVEAQTQRGQATATANAPFALATGQEADNTYLSQGQLDEPYPLAPPEPFDAGQPESCPNGRCQRPGNWGFSKDGKCGPDYACDAGCRSDCQACSCAGGCQCSDPLWQGWDDRLKTYFRGEVMVLKRDNTNRQQAVVIDGGTGDTLLSANDLEMQYELGPKLTFGVHLHPCWTLELSYFGTHHWHIGETREGNNNLAIPGDLGLASFDFFGADLIRVDYTADLHTAEANLMKSLGWVDLIAGFRFLTLDEELNIRSTDSDFGTSDYNILTSNDLYGAQLGLRMARTRDFWGWEGFVKAGLFGNDARQSQTVGDQDNQFSLRQVESNEGEVAFLGEAGLSLEYRFNDCWSVRGGYNVMWIDGLAQAPNQLDFTDTASSGSRVDTDATAFFHGANAGIEARW